MAVWRKVASQCADDTDKNQKFGSEEKYRNLYPLRAIADGKVNTIFRKTLASGRYLIFFTSYNTSHVIVAKH